MSNTYEQDITLVKSFKESEDVIIGIDEAGRGPVLGHLVYGAFIASKVRHNFRDSKVMTESERDKMMEIIKNEYSYAYVALHPGYLSSEMRKRSLNDISYEAVVGLIKNIVDSKMFVIKKIYLDALGPESNYKAVLRKHFPKIEFLIEQKADSKYPIVSGASIVAKVNRDFLLRNWPLENKNFGSGYPSDPKTIAWLKSNSCPVLGFPDIVRFSWSTAQRLLPQRNSKPLKNPGYELYLE